MFPRVSFLRSRVSTTPQTPLMSRHLHNKSDNMGKKNTPIPLPFHALPSRPIPSGSQASETTVLPPGIVKPEILKRGFKPTPKKNITTMAQSQGTEPPHSQNVQPQGSIQPQPYRTPIPPPPSQLPYQQSPYHQNTYNQSPYQGPNAPIQYVHPPAQSNEHPTRYVSSPSRSSPPRRSTIQPQSQQYNFSIPGNKQRNLPHQPVVGPSPKPKKQPAIPSKASGGIPDPTPLYTQTSLLPTSLLNTPQHLLVIIDLNGTLLYRPSRLQPTNFIARPHTSRFLNYCIDTFTVVIWSSAQPENVKHMCNDILTAPMKKKVAAIWGRDKFNLSPSDYNAKTQCYKRLTKIWGDKSIAARHPQAASGGKWDQRNTVLIDDDNYKGRSEPWNLIEIPEFAGGEEKGDVLPQVHDYLNTLSRHDNVSAYMRIDPWKARAMADGPPGMGR